MHDLDSAPIRRLLAAVLLTATAGAPTSASAAACCISATSFGLGRLMPWEDYAAGLQVGHARSLGQWDSSGSLRWNNEEFSDGLTTAQPWVILRLSERFQLQAWLPVVANDRRWGSESQIAVGLGDAGSAVRFEILEIGERMGLPSLAVTAGALAPTGKRVEETSPPLFAGATGRGAWGGSLALEAEYALLPWFVRLDAGAISYLPFRRSDTGQSQKYGPVMQVSLSTGREIVPDTLILAAALTREWEASGAIDAATVPGSAARDLTLSGSVSWRVDDQWTLTGVVASDAWPDGAGMNRDARLAFTIGARRGHFRPERSSCCVHTEGG